MMSHARWTTLTSLMVGRSLAGTEFSPCTTVDLPVWGSDNQEARPGIGIPPVTVSLELRWPSRVSGTSLAVCGTSSMAANLTGWSLYTNRANVSPTAIWTGVMIAATVNGMMNPSRW